MNETKAFDISREDVWVAYLSVKANKGCAGVDGVSMTDFILKLESNLYKIWNRMSSGCYFPPPVKVVEIPKGENDVRILGIPTISDRIAQMVVKNHLEPIVDPTFHVDSYGYRPNKSALDAVGTARVRCWKYDWVIDLDIKGFFDNIDHSLMMDIVRRHIKEKWILLYIERWLKAPAQNRGELISRDTGTPQGGVISPLLANMFLDYVFDQWMKKNHPSTPFERYADDIVVHCHLTDKPKSLLGAIRKRLADFKLQLHPEKTKIVSCKKKDDRKGKYKNDGFTFLGFDFRRRPAKNKWGELFVSFLPAISRKAEKSLRDKIRSWKIGRYSQLSIEEIAEKINPTVRGWINYYGRFYKSALTAILRQIEDALIKWAMRKFKKYRQRFLRTVRLLGRIAKSKPSLMAHWGYGVKSKAGW